VVARVKHLFGKVKEMRDQRGQLYAQFREQVLADDITKKIVTRSSDDTQVGFLYLSFTLDDTVISCAKRIFASQDCCIYCRV